jgi:hypothetical protein
MDNRNGFNTQEKTAVDCGKIQDIFEILNRTFSEFYNLSENLAFDIVIVLFTGRVIVDKIVPRSTNVLVSSCTNYVT